jgi:DNA topoisomerase-3
MASPFSVAVVAEKPSVARDIARVLQATSSGQGYLHGNGYVVTWAIGHLVALAQPGEIRPEWKHWRLDTLPMLPVDWPLVVGEQTKDQFEVVRKIITSPKIGSVICATDAGREGELIFRYIYEAAGCDKPVERLWISSLTPEAIRAGFDKVRDWSHYHPLADAAKGRSRADWLVGMNLSRAYTLGSGEDVSVGRVQTPTLAMLVERELAIRKFVVEDYLNVVARFKPEEVDAVYEGTWFRPGVEPQEAAMRLPSSGEEAAAVVARVEGGEARIEKIEAQTKRMAPPPLYDLTELQRHANRLYGFSAQRTLDLAQALYEKHKLISYPRTDSRHLSADVARTLPKIVKAISGAYAGMLAAGTGERPLGKRFVDDAKVSDHHAIIPTGVSPGGTPPDEQKIYDLICRRLLSAWHDEHVWAVTSVTTLVVSGEEKTEDRFHSSGTAVQQVGWKVLDIGGGKKAPKGGDDDSGEGGQALPAGLEEGQAQRVLDVRAAQKKTRPPKRFTEGTLLTAMETAGKTLDDKELSDAMKENGLGTPATRAQIIEVLIKRAFLERRGKSLEATDKGIRLIEVVHPEVKSPAMTGQWEAYLKRIERGEAELAPFLRGIEDYVREVVGKAGSVSRQMAPEPVVEKQVAIVERKRSDAPRDFSSAGLHGILKERFGFAGFRPNQEAVCQALVGGEDVLLVMPTGSGKSLCYQLPGIALGGTTLVISPLIALMEDQVAKMNALGFAADRIHSGRSRATSRDVCFAYLEGRLDFLFIAPERLRVQGFPEMLAKRRPCLIAIDEAHCISQWGHDFRPDYRTIGQHLPALRPAPVIALTATATPMVQNDIARQLDLADPRHFIHGFRRDNIAIEVVKAPQSARPELVLEILSEEGRRPAIVYSPKRRDAETLARSLGEEFPAAAYHAGLEASVRHDVQTAFLSGRLEVIVATIAFGMGIDKPDVRTVIHTALPGSLEGYYQEMGRAGRDGLPSRAILMHAYSDRYTHDFFFERDYPEPEVLAGLYQTLTMEPMEKDALRARSRMGGDEFDTALEKLWIHGGAVVDYAENVSRGTGGWRELYLKQREHKMAQFEKMLAYCETPACRMTSLVRYFGDTGDSARKCGVCDFCEPSATVGQQTRAASGAERAQVARLLEELKATGPVSAGRLYTQAFADGSLERRGYEELLGAVARSGLVEVMDTSFEKDGKVVEYRKVRITAAGEAAGEDVDVLIPVELKAVARKSRARTRKAAAPKGRTQAVAKRAAAKPAAAPPKVEFEPAAARTDRTAAIEAAIKAWRLAEAKKKGVPAFRVMTDKVLRTIAETEPATTRELLAVPGIGLTIVEKYGAIIFRILQKVG